MGKIKDKKEEIKEVELTQREWDHLKMLNYALQTSVVKDQVIAQFFYLVCITRFDYNEKSNLLFETDLGKDDRILRVKDVTDQPIEQSPSAKN